MRPRAEAAGVPENLMTRVTDAIRQSIVENSANRYLTESYTLASGRVSALRSRNLSGVRSRRPDRTNAAWCHPRACSTARMLPALKPSCTWPRTISVGVPRASVAS